MEACRDCSRGSDHLPPVLTVPPVSLAERRQTHLSRMALLPTECLLSPVTDQPNWKVRPPSELESLFSCPVSGFSCHCDSSIEDHGV